MPWVSRGVRDGVVTTGYPRRPDDYADRSVRCLARPHPRATWEPGFDRVCSTGAISQAEGAVRLDHGRCIGCGACVEAYPDMFSWQQCSEHARLA